MLILTTRQDKLSLFPITETKFRLVKHPFFLFLREDCTEIGPLRDEPLTIFVMNQLGSDLLSFVMMSAKLRIDFVVLMAPSASGLYARTTVCLATKKLKKSLSPGNSAVHASRDGVT